MQRHSVYVEIPEMQMTTDQCSACLDNFDNINVLKSKILLGQESVIFADVQILATTHIFWLKLIEIESFIGTYYMNTITCMTLQCMAPSVRTVPITTATIL